MDPVSRRSALGVAAGLMAGGMLAAEAAAGEASAPEKPAAGPHGPAAAKTDSPYKFSMSTAPVRRFGESTVREHKLDSFPMSSNMAATIVHLAAGDVREPHWHPNSDEWLFVMSGKIRMTIVDGHGAASQFDCGLEDVAFTPLGFGHYVENIGDSEARLMLIHNHAEFTTVNLSEWVAAGSLSVFASTLNMPLKAFDEAPTKRVFIEKKSVKG